jgi:hypothetical protein
MLQRSACERSFRTAISGRPERKPRTGSSDQELYLDVSLERTILISVVGLGFVIGKAVRGDLFGELVPPKDLL